MLNSYKAILFCSYDAVVQTFGVFLHFVLPVAGNTVIYGVPAGSKVNF